MSNQNTSSAVMAQRKDSPDELDYYPTPPWGTRALLEHLFGRFLGVQGSGTYEATVWEPTCGEGFMSRPLSELFERVISTDVQDFSATFPEQNGVQDFLIPWDGETHDVDWCIFNPPYVLAQEFIERALNVAKVGVAALCRLQFLEGCDRYETLFQDRPPSKVIQFAERLPMQKGKIEKGLKSATAYAWFIWDCEHNDDTMIEESLGPRIGWFPRGTKKRLERPGDYPEWASKRVNGDLPLFETIDGGEYRA